MHGKKNFSAHQNLISDLRCYNHQITSDSDAMFRHKIQMQTTSDDKRRSVGTRTYRGN